MSTSCARRAIKNRGSLPPSIPKGEERPRLGLLCVSMATSNGRRSVRWYRWMMAESGCFFSIEASSSIQPKYFWHVFWGLVRLFSPLKPLCWWWDPPGGGAAWCKPIENVRESTRAVLLRSIYQVALYPPCIVSNFLTQWATFQEQKRK